MRIKKRSFKNLLLIAILVTLGTLTVVYLMSRQQQANAQSIGETGVVQQITRAKSVETNGSIEPLQSADVYWKTTGTVVGVNVEEGSRVKAGDVLMILDPASVPGNVASAQVDLANAHKNLDDLYANADTTRVQAQQSIANYAKAVRDAQYQLENYTAPADQAKLPPMDAMDQMKAKLDQAWRNFEPYMYYPESDPTREDLKDELDQAQSDYDAAVKRVQYINQLEVAEANLEKARQDYEKWRKGPDPEEVAIVEARIAAAEATLRQLQIIAPFDGEVLAVNYKAGDVVISNLAAVSMADRSELYVEVKVDEADFSGIKTGDPATVTLDALPDVTLNGQVTFINLMGQVEQGIVKYVVHIALDSAGAEVLIPLGATANVTIQSGEPKQALAVPISAIQNDSQGEYVTCLNPDGSTRRVDILSGDLEGDLAIVAGDLQVGDQLLLAQGTNQTMPGSGMFGGGK